MGLCNGCQQFCDSGGEGVLAVIAQVVFVGGRHLVVEFADDGAEMTLGFVDLFFGFRWGHGAFPWDTFGMSVVDYSSLLWWGPTWK